MRILHRQAMVYSSDHPASSHALAMSNWSLGDAGSGVDSGVAGGGLARVAGVGLGGGEVGRDEEQRPAQDGGGANPPEAQDGGGAFHCAVPPPRVIQIFGGGGGGGG